VFKKINKRFSNLTFCYAVKEFINTDHPYIFSDQIKSKGYAENKWKLKLANATKHGKG
jgi:hypothetical protein